MTSQTNGPLKIIGNTVEYHKKKFYIKQASFKRFKLQVSTFQVNFAFKTIRFEDCSNR